MPILWIPPDFVKGTILAVVGKEQSERRTGASAVATEVPGPDAGPRERRSSSASPPYIPHASSQAMKTTQLESPEQ